MNIPTRQPPMITLSTRAQLLLWGGLLLGALGFVIGVLTSPEHTWVSFLSSSYFYLTIALGGVVFLALGYVGAAGWSTILKRPAEALTAWLPFGAISMLLIIVGAPYLYHWTHEDAVAHDALLTAKAAYLNLPFFAARSAIALSLWLIFAVLLRRNSRRQDQDGNVRYTRHNVALSAAFLFIFAFTFTFTSVDWMMSREPHWVSTIFGWYNLAGVLTTGVAAVTVLALWLKRNGLLDELNESHAHDLGKYLFGFSTFWAYLWFSQYLLIWYANLPEETAYYLARTHGGWSFLFYFNLVAGWLLPFIVLLPRPAKRSEEHLFRVALWVLGARWLDSYLMAAPGGHAAHSGIGLIDVALFLGFTAAFLLITVHALRRAPLLPVGDPYLIEALHHHT